MPPVRVLGVEETSAPRGAGQWIAFALMPLRDCPALRGVEATEPMEGRGDGD